MRRRLLALCTGLALAGSVHALPGDETLLLDLCINDRCVGVAPVIARGDDVLVDREALAAASIDTSAVTPEHLGERDFISLHQLNHGSTFAIDRSLLRLDLHLRPERLPHQDASLYSRPAVAEQGTQSWTAFLNYAATVGNHDQRNVFFDAAVGRGNAALRSTGGWDDLLGWQRGLTRFEYDQVDGLRRWTVGDQYAIARDPLAGGQLLGGIGVERAFDLDPYLITFPQPYYSGVLEAPGTVEVYSNGTLIGRSDLAAGPFTLERLGITPGRNDVRVIVRDPLGNRSELATQSYYGGSPRLLAKGLSEYAVRLGAPRTDSGFGDGGYASSLAMQAWYRRGLSQDFTLGGRIEGNDTLRNVGMDTAFNTAIGEFAIAVAASDRDGLGTGHASSFNYSYSTRLWALGLGTLHASDDYRRLSDVSSFATLFAPTRENDYASFSFTPASGLALQLNAGRHKRVGTPVERSAGMSASWQLGGRAQMYFVVQRLESTAYRDTTAQLNFNIAFDRDSFSASAVRQDRNGDTNTGYGFDARRSRPADTGFGYSVSLHDNGDNDSQYALGEYEGRFGRYSLEAERYGSDTGIRGVASGALVAVGGRMFATPPVESGFALVRVPGLANVPIMRENVTVGRTDAHGDLLVRDLMPFQSSRVAVDTGAVSADVAMDKPEHKVQVARNTGSVVTLEARTVHAVTGHFKYAGAGAGDLAHIADAGIDMPIGSEGMFYFEGLKAGRNVATIEHDAGNVRCVIDVPAQAAGGVTDLGDITCEAPQ
ncbi:hypothetical protein LYSCAS_25650 [Lysobacter caseinilyticus]|uniref:Fimbrial biogenesis outer membrane usher protein n=1 Tax=Noviluteimonas caseinilytica TaxID=2675101 RepID=A0ABM7Q7X9_9GAMM|nr:hypothetical protein LYSCAS_25650 [Lysobacter caseinilyticus]